jgi:glycolate oxidase iron-sulfur subunit
MDERRPQDLFSIDKLDQLVTSCMKCGFCKAVCPLFSGSETTSPRAKVRLAKAVLHRELETTPGIEAQMRRCLNCRACAAECPSGVEPNKVALAMRAVYVEKCRMHPLKRLVFRVGLAKPRLMAWVLKALGFLEQVTAIELQNNPLRCVLPLLGLRRDKDLPVLGRRSLMSRLPERIPPVGKRTTTVLYFPGCAVNFIYPEIGLAVVSILRKLGAEVILPHDIVCCSTPVFNSGDLEGARVLAEKNVQIMLDANAEAIVTSCGSCGLTIKHEWVELLGLNEAKPLSQKVMDIAEFVAQYVAPSGLKTLEDFGRVTYHDSCHLRRGMGVYVEPRELLTAILGDQFVGMEQADRCCGGGGTFSLFHPDLSQEVAETKVSCILQTGAHTIATGCPACIMQLRDSFVHRGMRHNVVHTAEIINYALQPNV